MEIVKAIISDIPEIVELLKKSLGEKLMPKSEAFFIWKHFQNPFGESVIWLAKEEGKIIGIRAFMCWRWMNKDGYCNAVRAVDTATDPAFQGKGIFSKLTMKAIETSMENNIDFVFNSPNKISIKGYLKLGWYSNGKMPMMVKPVFRWPVKNLDIQIQKGYDFFSVQKAIDLLGDGWELKNNTAFYCTPLSKSYLKWRYQNCPVADYGAIIEPNHFGLVFRLKKRGQFIECRICEIWLEDPLAVDDIKIAMNKLIQLVKPLVLTCAPSLRGEYDKLIKLGFWGPFNIGPEITLRTITNNNLNNFNQYFKWAPSLGALELF